MAKFSQGRNCEKNDTAKGGDCANSSRFLLLIVYQAHTPAAWRRNGECGISGTDWANKKTIFFKKSSEKVCRFKKKLYLCTRFRQGTTLYSKRRRSLTSFHTDKAVQRGFYLLLGKSYE